MNASEELRALLAEGEVVEGVVFGPWGPHGRKDEPTLPIPKEKQGVVLTLDEAEPLMQSWRFDHFFGFGACYPTLVWTSTRIFWVGEHDGRTRLEHAPRNPASVVPRFAGGDGSSRDEADDEETDP